MPLIGFDTACHNVTSRVFDRVTWVDGLPKLDQNRLRTTWIAWLMQRPLPLSVICTAAGLKSTRTPLRPAQAHRHHRHVGRPA
jgi:hypothetical protein